MSASLQATLVAAASVLTITFYHVRRARQSKDSKPSIGSVLFPRNKASLDAALMAAENNNDAPLRAWYAAFTRAGHSEVIIVEDSHDSHRGRERRNLGSPLYIATVLDFPTAVQSLLSLGSDPNYVHPEHGDGAVLHAAENGYDEVLSALLSADTFDCASAPLTVDRKTFLGQGMPQYEEGGLSPLALAAKNARLSTVSLLLAHSSAKAAWLHSVDSFGRDLVTATLDAIALKSDPSSKKSRTTAVTALYEIARRLSTALGRDGADAKFVVPEHSLAKTAERRRQRILRARCLLAQRRREDAERVRGLKEIARLYAPKYNFASHPLEFVSVDADSESVKEPIDGVFAFPLVSPESCARLWREVHHYEGAAAQNASLPLHVRHDGNIGALENIGFEGVLKSIETAVQPILDRHFGAFEVYHAFLTRNFVGRAGNAKFKMHCDKSALTVNVCLHASDDLRGSTVGFYNLSAEEKENEPRKVPSDPTHRVYTHAHEVGMAVVHDGRQWHKTDPILRGTRGSLILWLREKSEKARPVVGQCVRLRATARVQGGVLGDGRIGVLQADDGVSRQPFEVAGLGGDGATSFYHTDDLIVVDEADKGGAASGGVV